MKNYYCNPINISYKYQFVKHLAQGSDGKMHIYREAADPSLVLFKERYYLFPSMTAGFLTSENLVDWEFHEFLSDMPVHDYAPDVRAVGEYLYFSASKRGEICSFYRTKDPLTEPFEEIPGNFTFWDPNLFWDEDGKLYFYWGCSNMTPIYGVELEPETMRPKTDPLVMFDSDNKSRGYERIGTDHVSPKTKEEIRVQAEAMIAQMLSAPLEMRREHGFEDEELVRKTAYSVMGDDPYIEGAWMTKYQGRYYLQYAIPGTEYNVYGDGVYVADTPLGPFAPAKNNPYSYKPGGFMNGAGHGSTMEDKEGNWWHTSTMTITCNDNMERRIGLWKAGFDSDGELFCDQRYGDWPVRADAKPFDKPDYLLLSYGKATEVSSGTNRQSLTDENAKTWWRAEQTDRTPWAVIDLGSCMRVNAVQINFMDEDIQAEIPEDANTSLTYDLRYIDTRKHVTRWLLEGSADGEEYFTLCDKRDCDTDLPHDFLTWETGKQIRYIRLTVKEVPFQKPVCVSGIRVFGKNERADLPEQTKLVKVERLSDLDLTVSWKQDDAVGHNILWGYEADKLYHSYLVFGKQEQKIGALVKGQPVYVRVDSFNEAGITEGEIIHFYAGSDTLTVSPRSSSEKHP